MIQLPFSDKLNIGYLSRLFDNTTNCYKFFWFQAILRKIELNKNRFIFEELINEMIADAWYMVTEYHLRLGPIGITDNLEEVVKYIFEQYQIRSSEKREKILAFLENTEDKEIKRYKTLLTYNVPYRLQAPFYNDIIIERRMWNGPKTVLTDRINEQTDLIYNFAQVNGLDSVIETDDTWTEYLVYHKDILRCWTQLKLIQYLQRKNPSVPGIADKIEAPAARDIERVRKYWKLLIEVDPSLHDIYGDIDLRDETISVDHFVPWQYVAHDELWNLHPTTKSINSKKSNNLPQWNVYFDGLSELEYKAYLLMGSNERIKKEFDKIALYHLNNQEIRNQLYEPGLGMHDFKQRLEHVISPIYESAKISGFREWTYIPD